MFLPYLLTFSRITIGLIFAYSFLAKVRDVGQFARTITNFKLLPDPLSKPSAILLLIGELAVVTLITVGGRLLPIGFGLAILLFLLFTTALTWTLTRNIQTPCHCFGAGKQPVTAYDLWRNLGFLLLAMMGLWLQKVAYGITTTLQPVEAVLIGVVALAFVLIWANLADIGALFQGT